MACKNPQAVCASAVVTLSKNNTCRMVVYYRGVNAQVEATTAPIVNLERVDALLTGATAFCTLDLLQGCWQRPLAEDGQELFVMVAERCTLLRVRQGVLNAIAYFQHMMASVLDGLVGDFCLLYMHNVVQEHEPSVPPVCFFIMGCGSGPAKLGATIYRRIVLYCTKC